MFLATYYPWQALPKLPYSHILFATDSIFSNAKGKKEFSGPWVHLICLILLSERQLHVCPSHRPVFPSTFIQLPPAWKTPLGSAKTPTSAWALFSFRYGRKSRCSAFWLALFSVVPPSIQYKRLLICQSQQWSSKRGKKGDNCGCHLCVCVCVCVCVSFRPV